MSVELKKNKSEFKQRAAKVRKEMDNFKIDAALIYLDKRSWAYGDFSWLTNHIVVGPNALLILPKEGTATMLVSSNTDLELAKEYSFIDDVRLSTNYAKDTGKVLADLNLLDKSVGLVGIQLRPQTIISGMPGPENELGGDFRKELAKTKLVPASDLVIKPLHSGGSEKELALIRKCCEIADIGFSACLEKTKVGMREYEMMAEIEYAMRKAGMNDQGPFLMCSGSHTYKMYGATDKKLEEGDMVSFEITPSYQGYVMQICRTAVLGKISPERKKEYVWAVKAIEDAEERMKPGVEIGSIAEAQNELLKPVVSFKRYRRGHLLGGHSMDLRKGSQIELDNHWKLEKGMAFTIHPNQYNPKFGYMAIGCQCIVTDTGLEHLTKHTHELVGIPT